MAPSLMIVGSTGSAGRSMMGVVVAQRTEFNVETVVHGRAQWRDEAVTAELALPDMVVPVTNALHDEVRLFMDLPRLDLAAISRLIFEKPEGARFPCPTLAKVALGADGALPTTLNAANEIAGEAYMADQEEFYKISEIVESVCSTFSGNGPASATVTGALAFDCEARILARPGRFRKAHVRRS